MQASIRPANSEHLVYDPLRDYSALLMNIFLYLKRISHIEFRHYLHDLRNVIEVNPSLSQLNLPPDTQNMAKNARDGPDSHFIQRTAAGQLSTAASGSPSDSRADSTDRKVV